MKKALFKVICVTIALVLVLTTIVSAQTQLSYDQFMSKMKSLKIDTNKKVSAYTDKEIEKIVEILPQRYIDLKGNEWYIKDLAVLTARGIVNGDTLNAGAKFYGGSNVTRAEFITMLALADSTDANALKESKLSKEDFVYKILGVTKVTATANQKKIVENCFKGSSNITSVADKWYAKYLADLRLSTWGYVRYNHDEMSKPITRAECLYLLSEKFLTKEFDKSTLDKMYSASYFSDLPTKFASLAQSNGELYNKNASTYDKEIGIANLLKTYYPKFENVVSGKELMPVKVKQAINLANYAGVSIGDGISKSNWSSPITKAEAITVIMRTLNTKSRVDVSKRIK